MDRVGVYCASPLIADGKLRRFKVPPSRRANGWYWLVERDGKLYGAFGDWKTQVRSTIGSYDRNMRTIVKARSDRDDVRAQRAAARAAEEWASAMPSGDSPYLEFKKVAPFGVRYSEWALLIPMHNKHGKLIGIQKIFGSGDKRFTKGCAKMGASFTIIGKPDCYVLCEGYATGASIHMATGLSVIVCFDAGNMVEVAQDLVRSCGKKMPWLIAGDNDRDTHCSKHRLSVMSGNEKCGCNPGLWAAKAASRILGCRFVLPVVDHGTDFNDLHQEAGLIEVAAQIYEAL